MLMRGQRGVSLVELMVGLGIASFLLVAGVPAFSSWIQNSQNRAAAESVLAGLQLARVEAVKRNTVVRFDLTDATGRVAWNVGCVTVTTDCPASIQRRVAEEGFVNARVGISTVAIPTPIPAGYFGTPIGAGAGLNAGVSFTGMGRVLPANVGSDIAWVDVTNAASANARRYVVMIGTGGLVRMCDPALDFSSNPQGCS
jgi:type IV fimbrial biogenesis protein FimT